MSTGTVNHWAAGVAKRLKVIQSNWAEEELQVRQDYIRQEVSRSLEQISASDRPMHLKALQRYFPSRETPQTMVVKEASEPLTLDETCTSFISMLRGADEEAKAMIMKRLEAAGITAVAKAEEGSQQDEMLDLGPDVIRRLRLKPGSQINPARVLKLLVHLLDAVLSIDDLVWNLWKKIAPNSSIMRKHRSDLRTQIGYYLTNNPSVSFSDVSESMDMSRRVNTSLLGALGPLGRNFSARHSAKFSPMAIEEAVELEGGGGFLKAKAVQCWQKYEELSKDMDETAVNQLLNELLSSYAEELMVGPKARQQTRHPFR